MCTVCLYGFRQLIRSYVHVHVVYILLLCRCNDAMDDEDSDSNHSSIQEPEIDKGALEAILED